MLQKYNIAYVPSKNPGQFIQSAKMFSQSVLVHKYCLGVQSIPHVTLCHFEMESHKIEDIWEQIGALDLPKLHLNFREKRSKTYPHHPKWSEACWVSLMPDHLQCLTEIHLKVAAIIKNPFNAAFSDYDPHLTLFSSQEEAACALFNEVPLINPPLDDEFHIVLGLIDEVGQLTEILFNEKSPIMYV